MPVFKVYVSEMTFKNVILWPLRCFIKLLTVNFLVSNRLADKKKAVRGHEVLPLKLAFILMSAHTCAVRLHGFDTTALGKKLSTDRLPVSLLISHMHRHIKPRNCKRCRYLASHCARACILFKLIFLNLLVTISNLNLFRCNGWKCLPNKAFIVKCANGVRARGF